MPSDGKSSYCLWQGELIRGKKCQKIVIIELDLDIHKIHTYHTLLQADIRKPIWDGIFAFFFIIFTCGSLCVILDSRAWASYM